MLKVHIKHAITYMSFRSNVSFCLRVCRHGNACFTFMKLASHQPSLWQQQRGVAMGNIDDNITQLTQGAT